MGGIFAFWHSNLELLLAAITLIALLIGWAGGAMTEILPGWAIALTAIIAFAAGGYSGLMGAIEEARQGKLDIDFLMIAAAIGSRDWRMGGRRAPPFSLHLEWRAGEICPGTHPSRD